MDTNQMLIDLKAKCESLEAEKAQLMSRVDKIAHELTAYYGAIKSLETVSPSQIESPVNAKTDKHHQSVEYKGETHTLAKWSVITGINYKTLWYRLAKGMPLNEVFAPVNTRKKNKKTSKPRKVFAYDAHGNIIRQYAGIAEASSGLNLPATTIEKIISNMSKDDQLRVRNYYLAYVA